MRKLHKVYGKGDDCTFLQYMARVATFLGVFTGSLWVLTSTIHERADACYPQCRIAPVATTPPVVAPLPSIGPAVATAPAEKVIVDVGVYGDSRAWFLAEGASRTPGWRVTNFARQGCTFLGQDHIWKRYVSTQDPDERSSSEQTTGETFQCDTRTYISADLPRHDVAVVYVGSLFAVDGGVDSTVHSPTDPTWGQYLEDNLVETLQRIPADRIVVLGTPTSSYGLHDWGTMDELLWARADRLEAVDAILGRASERVGALFLPGFAEWVEAQPASCQSDGSHFTLECAERAGEWIQTEMGKV